MNNRQLIGATSGVFVLGAVAFAPSLQPLPALATLVGCAGVLGIVWTSRGDEAFLAEAIDFRFWAGCLLASLLILVVGGEGHFLHATNDWLIRDAILADVALRGLPAIYNYEGVDYLLRAPLGMYMLPGLAGRFLGLFPAHLFMLAQNATLLASVLYFLAALAPARRLAVLSLFLLFAGLDIIPLAIEAYGQYVLGRGFWLASVTAAWAPWFSFSNHFTMLFWVPNHTLPAWWFAVLALMSARGKLELAPLGAILPPLALWSPLAIFFAPVFVLYLAARAPLAAIASRRNWLAAIAALLIAPILVYMTAAAEMVRSELMILREGFVSIYVLTLCVQIPHAFVVLWNWRLTPPTDRGLFIAAMFVLLVIPAYSLGPTNDFSSRCSIAPLAILAFEFALVATRIDEREQPLARLAVVAIFGIGLFGPGFEIMRALTRARFAISDCTFMQAWYDTDHSVLPANYLARVERMQPWLMRLDGARPLALSPKACWPDHPMPETIHH